MALDQSALLEVLEALKAADVDDRIRSAATTIYQALIEAELTAVIGAGPHERTDARTAQRNGSRPRTLTTTAGDLELRIPKLRAGSFFPSLLERRRRIDQALFAVVREAYLHGVSTRKVDDLVRALGADTGISKSEVSRICADLDAEVSAFADRSLTEQAVPYVFLDATYCTARVNRRVVSQAVVIATGVAADGHREVLGCAVGDSEDGAFWTAFLRSLKARGLGGTGLVISDAHAGLKAAISAVLLGAAWQRCRVHWACQESSCRFSVSGSTICYARRGEVRGQLATRFEVLPHLNERQQRLTLACEARLLGHGGVAAVAATAGVSPTTVRRGMSELDGGEDPLPVGRSRRPGGGRKPVAAHDPELVTALLGLVEPDERGDPMSPLRWTTKSLRHLAAELTERGHRVSAPTVGHLLRGNGFSLQGTAKTLEGTQHPDRDAQFEYINEQVKAHQADGQPVVSVDAKKKEQLGQLPAAGQEWRPQDEPVEVEDHSFFSMGPEMPLAIPYGVYDLTTDAGWVNVEVDHDTSAF